jgi:arylsulfatase A-like enzyme
VSTTTLDPASTAVATPVAAPAARPPARFAIASLIAWSLVTWLAVIPARAHTMKYDWYWLKWPSLIPAVVAGAWLDLVYMIASASAFALALALFRRPPLRRLTWIAFFAWLAVTIAWAIVNAPLVAILGQPLNYAWLYNSGFLRGLPAFDGVIASLTPAVVLQAAGGMAAFVAFGLAVQWLFHRLAATPRRFGLTVGALGAAAALYLPLAIWQIGDFYRPMLQNPAVAFASSLLPTKPLPIFSAPTELPDDDFAPRAAAPLPLLQPAERPVKNVLLIVLESVAAQYLPAYGSLFDVTPNLERYRAHTRTFLAIHAHAPNTNKTMLSLLCSTYPSPDYLLETLEHERAPFTALSDVLKREGYRTGMFYAADLRFGNSDGFLAARGFEALHDYRSIGDGKPNCLSREAMPFLHAVDDATVAREVLQWTAPADDRPFFAVMWSAQTHYPYFNLKPPQAFTGAGEMQTQYLNALRETDEAIGLLLDGLASRGQLDSTLVVVVGDHGEAFGQHGQRGHGSKVYNENVHVPLLLINRHMFGYDNALRLPRTEPPSATLPLQADPTVGGMVDVAPTILHALGIPAPAQWQGASLFSPQRSPRTYFLAPWSTALFGYREGSRKFIFHADTDAIELYDLGRDPDELVDRAAELTPEERSVAQRRLARWVQHQAALFKSLKQ